MVWRVVTVGESFADDPFYYFGCAFFIKLFEGVVIFLSIDELDIDRHKTFSYEEIVVDDAPDASVAVHERVEIFKSEMGLFTTFSTVIVKISVFSHFFTVMKSLSTICMNYVSSITRTFTPVWRPR